MAELIETSTLWPEYIYSNNLQRCGRVRKSIGVHWDLLYVISVHVHDVNHQKILCKIVEHPWFKIIYRGLEYHWNDHIIGNYWTICIYVLQCNIIRWGFIFFNNLHLHYIQTHIMHIDRAATNVHILPYIYQEKSCVVNELQRGWKGGAVQNSAHRCQLGTAMDVLFIYSVHYGYTKFAILMTTKKLWHNTHPGKKCIFYSVIYIYWSYDISMVTLIKMKQHFIPEYTNKCRPVAYFPLILEDYSNVQGHDFSEI